MADISKVKLPDNVTYNLKDDGAVRKTGGTMTGALKIKGTAASNPLIVRGISGSDGDGDVGDLHLNYNSQGNIFLGGGTYYISANGSQYNGNAATASKATAANLTTTQYGIAYYTNTTGTFGNNPCLITTSTGGLEVKGMIAGDSGSTGHGLYGGGGYHNAYNNILLHGDASTGSSGIAFVSDKITASTGAVTNVNQPSDRAFIQYHACGITTATAEGTNPTLATSGETGRLVIGIGNDATDQIWLQTPSRTGLIHQVGATSYVIPDTNNTTGSVGSATNPVYVADGIIKGCTYSLNKTVPSDAVFTDTNTHRPIYINAAGFLESNDIPFNINAGSNITLVPDVGTATVTIKGTANNAVTQTNSTTNKDYRILLSNTDNDFDETGSSYKSSKLKFNPSTGALTCTGNIYTNSEGVFGTGIELGMYAYDSLSFIDFHWNSTNTDWTARIVQRGENTVDLIGKNSSTWGIWRAASFSSQSSIHVKENVQSITAEDARKLLQLRPVTFNYKNGGQVDQAGLIAEEVNLIMPKMVIGDINFNPEEPWNAPSIDYSKFVPYLIKMIQIQQKEIDKLKGGDDV